MSKAQLLEKILVVKSLIQDGENAILLPLTTRLEAADEILQGMIDAYDEWGRCDD